MILPVLKPWSLTCDGICSVIQCNLQCDSSDGYSRLGAQVRGEGTLQVSSHLRLLPCSCEELCQPDSLWLGLTRPLLFAKQFIFLVNFPGLGASGVPRKCHLLYQELPTSMNWKAKHQSALHALSVVTSFCRESSKSSNCLYIWNALLPKTSKCSLGIAYHHFVYLFSL